MNKPRIDEFRGIIQEFEIDVILLYGENNIFYACGCGCDAAQLLITPKRACFFTDGRYEEQARAEAAGCEIYISPEKERLKRISEMVSEEKPETLGMDFAGMSAFMLSTLEDAIDDEIEFADISEIISNMRIVKSEDELDAIRRASEFTDRAFNHILGYIKPGAAECEIKAELASFAIKEGYDFAFEPVIVSGVRGSLPHGRATMKPIERGELLTLDMGFKSPMYCSDFTRTVAVGEIGQDKREAYGAVLRAQRKALDAVCEGAYCDEVDRAARDALVSAGYGDNFIHGLGHGVGLDVHEAPTLNRSSKQKLASGMVVTVEPGVYLPDRFGIRIEDTVIVKNSGFEFLNVAERELIVV